MVEHHGTEAKFLWVPPKKWGSFRATATGNLWRFFVDIFSGQFLESQPLAMGFITGISWDHDNPLDLRRFLKKRGCFDPLVKQPHNELENDKDPPFSSWVNQLFRLGPFSIAFCMFTRG
jgi:hypothetical protein